MTHYLNLLTPQDYERFQEIELIREAIREQRVPINVIDYGAGDPTDNRSETQMQQGVLKQVNSYDLCRIGLKNEFAHLIYALVKKYQPKTVLELGTCCGFSAIYMSQPLSQGSMIHTIEGSPETAKIAQQNLTKAKVDNVHSHIGKFTDILPELLPQISPLDFVFIDGHHDEEATLTYFEQIKPYLNENALVLFDDISWSDGMKAAWKKIQEDSTITKFEDFHKLGLCFISKEQR